MTTVVQKVRGIILIGILGLLFYSCTEQASNIILADIGPERISIADYEHQFSKNNGGWEAAKNLPLAEREKFLDLLVKFRLKVLDAYRQGLDKDPEVVREIQEYRASLSESYFLDKEIVAPGLRQLYERKREEVRASHILIGLTPNPAPKDTLAAWQKAADILKRVISGEDFAKLVEQFSEDYAGRQNGGDIYYFSSGVVAYRAYAQALGFGT